MTRNNFENLAFKIAKYAAEKYNCCRIQLANYLTAIAATESRFHEKAENKHSTARGIMQVLICTQRENEKKRMKAEFAPAMYSCKVYPTEIVSREKDRMFDPEYSILVASYELAYQYKRYDDDWNKAVYAYNQGSYPQKSEQKDKDGWTYTEKVLDNYKPKIFDVAEVTSNNYNKWNYRNYKRIEFY